jgi:hypothetical protein
MSPGALGKLICAFVTGALRNVSPGFQRGVEALMQAPANARIYQEYTGTGHSFYRLKYRTRDQNSGHSCVHSVYMGALSDEELEWANAILAERAARNSARRSAPVQLDTDRIKLLTNLFRLAHTEARRLAPLVGFTFRGCRLMRRRP